MKCSECGKDLGNPDSAATRKSFARVFDGPGDRVGRVLCLDCAHAPGDTAAGESASLRGQRMGLLAAVEELREQRDHLVAALKSVDLCLTLALEDIGTPSQEGQLRRCLEDMINDSRAAIAKAEGAGK